MRSCGPDSALWCSAPLRHIRPAADSRATIRRFQTAYLVGVLVFEPVPGLLADALGSYLPAYRLLTGCALAAMALVQGTYLRRGGRVLWPAVLRHQGA